MRHPRYAPWSALAPASRSPDPNAPSGTAVWTHQDRLGEYHTGDRRCPALLPSEICRFRSRPAHAGRYYVVRIILGHQCPASVLSGFAASTHIHKVGSGDAPAGQSVRSRRPCGLVRGNRRKGFCPEPYRRSRVRHRRRDTARPCADLGSHMSLR